MKKQRNDVEWWEAIHKIQDWHAAGVSHRQIAERLSREGYRLSAPGAKKVVFWSDMAVTRELDRNPREPVVIEEPMPKWEHQDKGDTITLTYADGGSKELSTAFESEEEFNKFHERVREQAKLPRPQRAYPEAEPVDWIDGGGFFDGEKHDEYVNPRWLSSEDGWDKDIMPFVTEQIRATYKDAFELLDRIKGHAAERAQLRRLYCGMMRRIAIQDETILAKRGVGWPGKVATKPLTEEEARRAQAARKQTVKDEEFRERWRR